MEEPRPGEEQGRDDEPRSPTRGAQPETPRDSTPMTQQIGRAVVVVLIVLFGVFAASNAHPVDFSWIFGGTEVTDAPGGGSEGGVPLIVLLLTSFLVGAIVGGALVWQTGRTRRRAREAGSADEGA